MPKSRTENNRARFKAKKGTDHSTPNSVFEFARLKTVVAGEEDNYICLELSKIELIQGKMVLPWVLPPKKKWVCLKRKAIACHWLQISHHNALR